MIDRGAESDRFWLMCRYGHERGGQLVCERDGLRSDMGMVDKSVDGDDRTLEYAATFDVCGL